MKNSEKKKTLKKKIRDLKRSIEATQEPELKKQKEEYLHKLKLMKKLTLHKPALWEKYKSIKFFERKKVERKLKKLIQRIQTEEETQELLEEKAKLMDDLNYIKHYPLNKKYVSLFAENSENSAESREMMRQQVKSIIRKKQEKKVRAIQEELEENSKDDFFEVPFAEDST